MRSVPVLRWMVVLLPVAWLGTSHQLATTIPGGNIINQTWTLAGSPYIVQGDVTVPSGAFLTIQAGVSVEFPGGDLQSAGLDTTRVEMTINGTLTISGTAGSPVTLRAQSGSTPGTWYGIVVGSGATSAAITHAQIQHAVQGVRSSAAGSALQLSSSEVDTSTDGVVILAGSPVIVSVKANSNQNGFRYSGFGSMTLSSCIAHGNSADGVNLNATGGTLTVAIDHATLDANGSDGIEITAAAGASTTVTLVGSNVSRNVSNGVLRNIATGTTSVSTTYSNFWSNGNDFANAVSGTKVFGLNPLYVSSTDLTLTSNSPSRFAGSSGEDIGALPFAGAPTPGLYGTLWSNTILGAGGSPYTVGGDLTVAPGVTLSIDPGVTLTFATTDIMQPGDTPQLIIGGTLHAVGTSADRIVFTGAGTGPGAWQGIRFLSAASAASSLYYATIEEAAYGLRTEATGSITFSDLLITDAHFYGVYNTAGSPTFNAVQVVGGNRGFVLDGKGTPSLVNVIARSSSDAGIYIRSSSGLLTATIVNATVDSNGIGLEATSAGSGFHSNVTAKNMIVTNNSLWGVAKIGTEPTLSLTFSDVWDSGTNFVNVAPGPGVISVNPNYAAGPGNLHLSAGSPAIDAGTSTGAPTRDYDSITRPLDGDGFGGAAPDMGAYEYQLAAPAPGSVPETFGGPQPPLLVFTSDGGASLDLDWGVSCGGAIDYAVYEGDLGSWYSHVPVLCSTSGNTAASFIPGTGDRYYLVVPLAAGEEGGYGHTSSGLPIPASMSPCRAVNNLSACP